MIEISDLIHEMERRKIVFMPSKEEYLKYLFTYNCMLLEATGHNPCWDNGMLRECIHNNVQKDLNAVNDYYHDIGRPYTLYIPSLEHIPEHINYTLSKK